jgi:Na+-translocating ferredoxin:NAD+ oxidoreductase RnfG subunit
MQAIVDDILSILQADALIESMRVVNYDETPAG